METYVVHAVFAMALLFLAHWLYKSFSNARKKTGAPACGACPSCEAKTPRAVDAHANPIARL